MVNVLLTKNIRFKTPMLTSDLCNYTDMYIVVRERTNVKAHTNFDTGQEGVMLKNNATFRWKWGSTFLTHSCVFQQNKLLLPSLMDTFSNNSELLSTTDKMSWKLHGKLTRTSKNVNIKI